MLYATFFHDESLGNVCSFCVIDNNNGCATLACLHVLFIARLLEDAAATVIACFANS